MLKDLGIRIFHWKLVRSSLNPFSEINSMLFLHQIIASFKPDLVHAVAQKPVIYTGILRRFGGKFALVAALGGVGFIFGSDTLKAKLLRPVVSRILRFCLAGNSTRFILQNRDNIELFEKLNIVKPGFTKVGPWKELK